MTIEELADNSDLSTTFLSDVERCKVKISTDSLFSLALGLGLNDPATLLEVATEHERRKIQIKQRLKRQYRRRKLLKLTFIIKTIV